MPVRKVRKATCANDQYELEILNKWI